MRKAESHGDGALVRAVINGEPGAMERLFEHVYPLIEREVSMYSSLPQCDREDMAGAVALYLTQVAERICRNFRPDEGQLRNYFKVAIRRRCWRWYSRRGGQARGPVPEHGVEAGAASADDAVPVQVDSRRVLKVLQTWKEGLDPINRHIFEERIVRQRRSEEVGAELNLAVPAVNARVRRLREKLKTYLRAAGLLGVALATYALLAVCLTFWQVSPARNVVQAGRGAYFVPAAADVEQAVPAVYRRGAGSRLELNPGFNGGNHA